MMAVVNMADFNQETPIQIVQRSANIVGPARLVEAAEEDLCAKVFVTLLGCGAVADDMPQQQQQQQLQFGDFPLG